MSIRVLLGVAMLAATCMATTVLADEQPSPTAVPYHYGMKLDIQKVLSMSEPDTPLCQVITAHMSFLDSAGKVESINYRKTSQACSTQLSALP